MVLNYMMVKTNKFVFFYRLIFMILDYRNKYIYLREQIKSSQDKCCVF